MAEEKLIQVNLQLPVSELAGLTALMERLEHLLTGSGHPISGEEQAQNTVFDEARFTALAEETALPTEVGEAFSGEAAAVQIGMTDLPAAVGQSAPALPDIGEASAADDVQWTALSAAAVTAAADGMLPSPPAAGLTVSEGKEIPYTQHGNSSVERLITVTPAPLTAEAVSLAFRRDDRRYDNGFPLY